MLFQYDGENTSITENRLLAAWPGPPTGTATLPEWPVQFDSFVADHFGFRSDLVRFYNLIHVKLGTSTVKKVLVGKNNWLFLEQTKLADSNRGAYPFKADRLAALVASFEKRQKYLERLGKYFIVFPTPDKNSLFPEFLPDSVKIIGPSRFVQFRDAALAADFLSVDTLPALKAAKKAGEDIYFQTDSHWNCRGAWFAYLALMKTLRNAGYTGGKILDESEVDFIRPENPRGSDIVRLLLNLEGYIHEPLGYVCRIKSQAEITASRPSDGLKFEYVYAAPPRNEQRRYKHAQPRDNSRVFIYRDSYANALLPFLIHTFDELIYTSPEIMMGFDPADVELHNPDLVIYQFVERGLFYPPDDTLLETFESGVSDGSKSTGSQDEKNDK